MFRFLQRFGRDSQARRRGIGAINRVRRRNHQLNCEALESRQMLSGWTCYIVNEASGKVLDDPGGSLSNGQNSSMTSSAAHRDRQPAVGHPSMRGGATSRSSTGASGMCSRPDSLSTSNGPYIDQSQEQQPEPAMAAHPAAEQHGDNQRVPQPKQKSRRPVSSQIPQQDPDASSTSRTWRSRAAVDAVAGG